jgi:hypothetical protein
VEYLKLHYSTIKEKIHVSETIMRLETWEKIFYIGKIELNVETP